jgi:hypothetical protein
MRVNDHVRMLRTTNNILSKFAFQEKREYGTINGIRKRPADKASRSLNWFAVFAAPDPTDDTEALRHDRENR